MSDVLPVAVDAMGGDHAPDAVVAGAVEACRRGHSVLLVGDADVLRPRVRGVTGIELVHAPDRIRMDEAPSVVRRRPDCSIRRALRLVAEGRAGAMVSCGNSGALVVSAVLDLGVLGAERPAIATALPRADGGRLVLLDAGASVDCRPETLLWFARLGVAYARVLGVAEPRVGLLSNGAESGKGNIQVRATAPLLESAPLDFVGHVEPPEALGGACDVLVCDGFVGNILVKSLEAAVDTVVNLLREEVRRRPRARLGTALMTGAFDAFRQRVAWDEHGGGLLLGVEGIVVVGHGRANGSAVASAIGLAARADQGGLVEQMRQEVGATSEG